MFHLYKESSILKLLVFQHVVHCLDRHQKVLETLSRVVEFIGRMFIEEDRQDFVDA